jgi:cobalt-zinc-cadmium efflux system outer membrane protein
MTTRKILTICLALIGICGSLWTQAAKESGLTLEQCVSIALEQNPLLLSSQEQYRASLARISQARAIPQPSLSYDSDLQPGLFNFRDSGESYFGVSQLVEFPGKRSIRGKIASRESDEILSEIELLKLDLGYQVKETFYGLLLAEEKLKYARQNLELAEDFLKKAEVKLAVGDIAKVEVLRARVEASRAASAVRAAENERRLAAAALNFLLGRRKYEPLEIRGEMKKPFIELDVDELRQRAFSFRPEIKRVGFALEREALIKKQGYMSYLPDFDLGLARHKLVGEQTTWDFTIAFPIPLFFWQPKKGEIAEAEANIESLKREEDHLKNAVSLEVEEAYMNALTASNQIKLFEEDILTQAEEVYNMFLFSFQEGEIGGIELIEARRSLIESRQAYADALFNYAVTIAALEKSVGQTLIGGHDD